MTDEEYQAMLKRLSAMREKSKAVCAAKKARRRSAPKPYVLDEMELDKYFQAKYKWKTAYAAPPPAPVVAPPMANAVRHTAQPDSGER